MALIGAPQARAAGGGRAAGFRRASGRSRRPLKRCRATVGHRRASRMVVAGIRRGSSEAQRHMAGPARNDDVVSTVPMNSKTTCRARTVQHRGADPLNATVVCVLHRECSGRCGGHGGEKVVHAPSGEDADVTAWKPAGRILQVAGLRPAGQRVSAVSYIEIRTTMPGSSLCRGRTTTSICSHDD